MILFVRLRSDIARHFPTRVSEWILAAVVTSWGAVLAQPVYTMSTPAYDLMLWIMPEYAWAVVCVSIGVLRLCTLVVNGTFPGTVWSRYSPHTRALLAFLSSGVLMMIALSFARAPVPGTGAAVYPWLFMLDLWNFFRCSIQAGQVDMLARRRRNGS